MPGYAMTSSTSSQPPALGAGWKAHYWRIRRRAARRLSRVGHAAQLLRLRALAFSRPRRRAGELRIAGLRLRYDDALSLYMEFKHIFAWGVYDFRPSGPRPLILDGGGHLGLSALRFKQLAPDARVIVFEPDQRARTLLLHNLRANAATDVEVLPVALGRLAGVARFIPDGADGGALANGETTSGQTASVAPLSTYLTEPVDFLKLNIEGAEADVLCEARARLGHVRQMVIEYHGFPELGQRLHEILSILDEAGFQYVVNHFDYETNPGARPPFHPDPYRRFFTLIGASRREGSPAPPVQHARPRSETPPQPKSREFGFDRGRPIDRHYIESFLDEHRGLIFGHTLEVGDASYTRRFGGDAATQADTLHLRPDAGATVVVDLENCPQLPDGAYDCFIMTQTLPFIYDVAAALRNTRRILKPGGALLLTVPGISQISRYDARRWGDYWRFTPQSLGRLLRENFGPDADIVIRTRGNVASASAFLDGRAAHELSAVELEHDDEDYPVIITARVLRGI